MVIVQGTEYKGDGKIYNVQTEYDDNSGAFIREVSRNEIGDQVNAEEMRQKIISLEADVNDLRERVVNLEKG